MVVNFFSLGIGGLGPQSPLWLHLC